MSPTEIKSPRKSNFTKEKLKALQNSLINEKQRGNQDHSGSEQKHYTPLDGKWNERTLVAENNQLQL